MPLIVGLTGQSGAGKSTASSIFRRLGAYVIDCDEIARSVTSDNSQCNKELSQYFSECFDENLHLDRKKMADIIFSDEKKLKTQNAIIFKYITIEIDAVLSACNQDYIILDAPTLFQSGLDKRCVAIIGVLSDTAKRFERIKARDSLSDKSILLRFSSQQDDDFFQKNCDIVIYNNSSLDELEVNVKKALEKIEEIVNGKKPKEKN
ncbi:MAG: dephospho-CoA kinase [Ruminococcus sp.]|nr:dephospho-CoA kinase [Ruminococcus sp.]